MKERRFETIRAGSLIPILLVFVLAVWPRFAAAAGYDGSSGPYAVRISDAAEVHWTDRDRHLPLRVYYPETGGPWPVIAFSHGAGGSRLGYQVLGGFLAGHGYVLIHPTHPGSDTSMLDLTKPLTGPENMAVIAGMAANMDNLTSRPRDLSLVIDNLPGIAQTIPELADRMDRNQVGVAGHSFGAYTALAVAGAYRATFEKMFGLRVDDPRVSAVVAMSPPGGRGGDAALRHTFSTASGPVMTMTGSLDADVFGKHPAAWRLQAFSHMPPGDKYSLWIQGAHHFTFNDPPPPDSKVLSRDRRPDPEHERWVKTFTLAFFDAYLKKKPEAITFLKQGWTDLVRGGAKLESK